MSPARRSSHFLSPSHRSATAHCRYVLSELSAAGGPLLLASPSAGSIGLGGSGLEGAGGVAVRMREAGALAEAADRLSSEAKRVGGPECEALARELESIRSAVDSMR